MDAFTGGSSSPSQAICACGSAWFQLRRTPSAEVGTGAVALDERGMVIAFEGDPVCVQCGNAWQPRDTRLRLLHGA